ncbi:hypothetical protein [Neisseria bacilliformis]|nr:hypothetical protein [Neisseria bacilliformis]
MRGLRHTPYPSGKGRLKTRFSDGLKPYRPTASRKQSRPTR